MRAWKSSERQIEPPRHEEHQAIVFKLHIPPRIPRVRCGSLKEPLGALRVLVVQPLHFRINSRNRVSPKAAPVTLKLSRNSAPNLRSNFQLISATITIASSAPSDARAMSLCASHTSPCVPRYAWPSSDPSTIAAAHS